MARNGKSDNSLAARLNSKDIVGSVETHRFAPPDIDMDVDMSSSPRNFQKPHSIVPDWRGHFVSPNYFRCWNIGIHCVVFGLSAAYASDLVIDKYPDAVT